MAAFNWFNRQFNNKPASETAVEPDAEAAKPTVEPEQSESPDALEAEPEPTPEAVNQDRLAWAKAAYANVRKQQVAEPSTAAQSEPPPAPEERDDIASEVTATPVAELPVEPTEPSSESEPIPSEIAEANSSELSELSELSASDTARPFWMQAEAERLERLERLQTEARQEEAAQAAIQAEAMQAEAESSACMAPAVELIPDFVLDEAFLWSAEVLAGQGRRADQVSLEEITWLKRLRQGLDKTRRSLVNQLRAIVGQGPLNKEAVTEIESLLLQADVGIEATDYIIESLQAKLREETLPPQAAIAYLKGLLREMLDKPLGESHSLSFVPEKDQLNIWLITGVNGAGKTTTIGKLAHIAQKSGYRCLIAAADTFRAAAVQQVKVWGERSKVEVIANPGQNTDPAAVVFDAIAAAQSRNIELLLVDTAGRLQNKKNLMEELSKIRRIIDKKAPGAQVESLLVLDSTLGQNGLRQAQVFSEAAQLSGVVLTKLDGTAKGGIALAVVQQLGLPIRFIGAGEGIEDLRPFSSYEFVEALLSG
jgi:fused signal recognition particle receptor